tara:strand:+ start:13654 stop:14919 length:1266 start_codon:yes stop_codon:yes gene_type:complete
MSVDEDYHSRLLRGRMLRDHSRYEDALEYFNQAIGVRPDSVEAFVEKALCEVQLGNTREAKASIDQAISIDPEHGMAYAVKALVLLELDRPRDGCVMAKKAVSIDAANPTFHRILGQSYFRMEKLDRAEASLREALSIDPDDETAANLLTALLRRQNRMDENRDHMDRLLESNPENAFTHFNAGYSALQSTEYKKAEEHFRESLRLDPNFDEARKGLLQSFRARSTFYSLFLRYCFLMQRLSGGARWGLIIGLLLAVRVGRSLLEKVHPSLAIALVAVYMIFVFWGFLVGGISNLIVLSDRNARYALKKVDVLEGFIVGGFFFSGLLFAACAMLFSLPVFLPLALGFSASTIPLSMCFNNDSKAGVWLFAALGSATVLAGLVTGVGNSVAVEPTILSPLLSFLLFGCMISTWLSGVKALHR